MYVCLAFGAAEEEREEREVREAREAAEERAA
jgi:hypothetical protein